jgi:erythromycin esterase-like protein
MMALRSADARNDEANVHAVRALLYQALRELLGSDDDDIQLPRLRSQLGAVSCPDRLTQAHAELSTALKGVDRKALSAARARWAQAAPSDLSCQRSYGSAWPRACVVTGLRAVINPLAELEVLARLAGSTEQEVRDGNESQARELRSLQRQLLSQHSGMCLETLGAHLASSGEPIFAGLGRALERLIEVDVLRVGA